MVLPLLLPEPDVLLPEVLLGVLLPEVLLGVLLLGVLLLPPEELEPDLLKCLSHSARDTWPSLFVSTLEKLGEDMLPELLPDEPPEEVLPDAPEDAPDDPVEPVEPDEPVEPEVPLAPCEDEVPLAPVEPLLPLLDLLSPAATAAEARKAENTAALMSFKVIS